jgi:hypothetical protein
VKWADWENDYVEAHLTEGSDAICAGLAEIGSVRTIRAVQDHVTALKKTVGVGLSSRPWTEAEDEVLRANLDAAADSLVDQLPGRSVVAIDSRRKVLGLRQKGRKPRL